MVETKPYRTDRWPWHSIRDRYNLRTDWNKKHKLTLWTFFQYFCGPRYNFVQVLKILSLVILAGTCLFNIKLVVETNKKIEKHQLILDFDDDEVIPYNEEEHFNHLKVHKTAEEEISRQFTIKVVSSRHLVDVIVNGESVHRDDEKDSGRGIHIVVVHETTGSVMSQRVFDTYTQREDEEMIKFLKSITNNRIFVFTVKDEASFQLQNKAKNELKSFGSKLIDNLGWRSNWGMICDKKGTNYAEKLQMSHDETSWADPVVITVDIDSVSNQGTHCTWPDTLLNNRRSLFCSKFEGYADLCNCDNPSPLNFDTGQPLPASFVPVAVIASNRPQYLYRSLRSILSADGANPNMVVVFIDGHFEEPYEVAKLFGLKVFHHMPVGVKNARISQHYKSSLGAMFNIFPDADEIIILEEDLDVSPDFFNYFSQTMHLLDLDSSLYCISAWNDQGYTHSSHDSALLYRVETMPGLGWMLKRSLFKEELEPEWPTQEKRWDWDMWMRSDVMRKGRECIIPDVSRTYHFGSVGVNMNSYFFDMYFEKHAINEEKNVKLVDIEKMTTSSYEQLMHALIRDSKVLNHEKSPCDVDFVPESLSKDNSYVAYFRMDGEDATDVFKEVLKCLRIWDLEPRGLHRGAFRTFINERHVVFVGYPASPYSLYKPTDLQPIYIEKSKSKNDN